MRELDAILEAWRDLEELNQDAVLATVVHVRGSAYRRPGARMLILPDGRRIGSISGGCLEGDLSRKAWWFTESGEPSVRVYDTSSGEDSVWEFGLGCNGVIEVLLERVSSATTREALAFLDSRGSRRDAVMAVVIRAEEPSELSAGDRLYADSRGLAGGALATRWPDLRAHVEDTLRRKQSRLVRLAGCEVFVEYLGPPVELVVFGAGHDAIPVVSLAARLGWSVTVADGRPAYATRARFPEAANVVVMHSGLLLEGIEITSDTVVVMMTHNYPQDALLLPGILAARPRYLGLLGPSLRAASLFDGLGLRPDSLDIHTPVGLDIGADTSEAIALSIVAEIQAELAGRAGMKLRHRRGPIHSPVLEAGAGGPVLRSAPELVACETSSGAMG